MKKLALASIATLSIVGCTPFKPQTIPISPTLRIQPVEVGHGKEIGLTVVDERPQKLIGNVRGAGIGGEISAQGDLAESIGQSISAGLNQNGFKSEKMRDALDSELRVEVRSLDYGFSVGLWDATLRVDAAMKAICIKGNTRPFEKLYRGEVRESVMVVQNERENTVYINKALSDAENKLLSDQELLQCLAK